MLTLAEGRHGRRSADLGDQPLRDRRPHGAHQRDHREDAIDRMSRLVAEADQKARGILDTGPRRRQRQRREIPRDIGLERARQRRSAAEMARQRLEGARAIVRGRGEPACQRLGRDRRPAFGRAQRLKGRQRIEDRLATFRSGGEEQRRDLGARLLPGG